MASLDADRAATPRPEGSDSSAADERGRESVALAMRLVGPPDAGRLSSLE
jgi:hypothetical protein